MFAALNLAGRCSSTSPSAHAAAALTAPHELRRFTAWAMHDQSALRATFGVGFCILFAFIGTFTYVNFVLVRPPFMLAMMSLGFVYFVFLPSIFTTPARRRICRGLGARGSCAGALALALIGVPLLLTHALPAVMLGMVLVGVGTFFAQAIATGFVGSAARSDRAAASGLYLASYFVGGLIGSALLGQLFDHVGWPATVAGIGSSLIIAAILADSTAILNGARKWPAGALRQASLMWRLAASGEPSRAGWSRSLVLLAPVFVAAITPVAAQAPAQSVAARDCQRINDISFSSYGWDEQARLRKRGSTRAAKPGQPTRQPASQTYPRARLTTDRATRGGDRVVARTR